MRCVTVLGGCRSYTLPSVVTLVMNVIFRGERKISAQNGGLYRMRTKGGGALRKEGES